MKCLFLLSACVLLSFSGAYAQTQIFNETFETNSATVGSWTMVDRDGDGANWGFADYNGLGFSSKTANSQCSVLIPAPDDLLVSPSIQLVAGKIYSLSYQIGGFGLFKGHYAVYIISAVNSFVGTETPVIEETLSQANAVIKTVNISEYAGQNIKLLFRYNNSVGQYYTILLDNVIVTDNSVTSGISNTSESAAVRLSPSPVGNQLQVSLSGGGDLQKVEVVDLNGRVARSVAASGASASVDVSGLSAGVYVARVVSGDGAVVRKFVKK